MAGERAGGPATENRTTLWISCKSPNKEIEEKKILANNDNKHKQVQTEGPEKTYSFNAINKS